MCRSATLNVLVKWYIRLPSLHGPQGKTALLQFRLRVVPVLVHDELLEPWEQARVAEYLAVIEILLTSL